MMKTFSAATFRSRLEAVQERMAAEKLDALIVHAIGSILGVEGRAQGHMRFLANWDGYNTPALLIVTGTGAPSLLVARVQFVPMARRTVWFEDVRAALAVRQPEAAAAILKERLGPKPRLGLIGRDEMPVPVWEALGQHFPEATWVEASEIVAGLRTIKTDAQLAYHRRGAEVCDRMHQTLLAEMGKGKRAYQLKADMERAAAYAGCEHVDTWMAVGPVAEDSSYFKEMNVRVPQAGDQLLVGVDVLLEGHWAHSVRSGTVGAPRPTHQKLFDLVLEMQETALAKLKPGGDLHDIYRAAEAVLSHHYPGWREKDIVFKRAGHSQGTSYDDVLLHVAFPESQNQLQAVVDNPEPIEIQPGMLFEIHPMVYIPGVAGGAIGDLVAVTETGNEILTQFPRELIRWR